MIFLKRQKLVLEKLKHDGYTKNKFVNEESPIKSLLTSNTNSFKNKSFRNEYNQNWNVTVLLKYLVT